MSKPAGRKNGCLVCGVPTNCLVQVWMRRFIPDSFDTAGNRRQTTVASTSVSMCEDHARSTYEAMVDASRGAPA